MLARYFVILECLFLLIFCASPLFGNENEADDVTCGGVLIVTFQTGLDRERLDRVRFFINDQEGRQQMYPKGSTYVDDPNSFIRMVVVDDLKPGRYSLEFIVPNADGLFAEIPKREFLITKDCVSKIDQVIKMHQVIESPSATALK